MILTKIRHEHEKVGATRKVRAMKKRRSRSLSPMTYDKNGKHARHERLWREERKRFPLVIPEIPVGFLYRASELTDLPGVELISGDFVDPHNHLVGMQEWRDNMHEG